ncbi:MAG: DUF4296 domain-containing protein [Bacteroidetes bacterium]|nr:DUF4296 domain-containing protein [Bacteroidota bacterium]
MRYISIVITSLLILQFACSNPEEQIKRSDIIPEEDLVPLLVDIHLSEGLLILSKVNKEYPGRDSVSNYTDVINKHGFEKEDFDKTIHFYSNKPDELDEIYELVISELSKMEVRIIGPARYTEEAARQMRRNLWNRKREWHLPQDGEKEQIGFNIRVYATGIYSLSARIKMYKDDESVNPSVFVYYWYNDGSKYGFRDPFPEIKIEKTGQDSIYKISKILTDPKVTHMKGSILYHKKKRSKWSKHVDVLDIKVEYNRTTK